MSTYRTWLEISSSALAHNVNVLRSCLAKDVTFIAVVKANAYGHGLLEIVQMLRKEGVEHFAVDAVEEAIRVRNILPTATIMTLGFIPDEHLEFVVTHDIQPVLYDKEQIELLNREAMKQGKIVSLHIKIETGTARQGVFKEHLPEVTNLINRSSHLRCVGLCTHFAKAEDLTATSFTQQQTTTFYKAVGDVAESLPELQYVHSACSAAILCHPDSHGTAVRAGLAMYGLWSSDDVKKEARTHHLSLHLQPILSWRSRVAQIKDYPAGTPIGYGGTELINRPTRVAVIPVGYYDGFSRSLSRQADVLIRGHRCKILGAICMNMLMVDSSRVPGLHRGDPITLIGQDGSQHINVGELAQKSGTISWEILSRISGHLPRIVV